MGIDWDGMDWDRHELLWNKMGWDRKICPMDIGQAWMYPNEYQPTSMWRRLMNTFLTFYLI